MNRFQTFQTITKNFNPDPNFSNQTWNFQIESELLYQIWTFQIWSEFINADTQIYKKNMQIS